MYPVIFSAEIANLDAACTAPRRMRELAMERCGCRAFTFCTQAGREIAIPYRDSQEQILARKQGTEHLQAQELGRAHWYASCSVEVAKIVRGYSS
jgi:hypothetical protein